MPLSLNVSNYSTYGMVTLENPVRELWGYLRGKGNLTTGDIITIKETEESLIKWLSDTKYTLIALREECLQNSDPR